MTATRLLEALAGPLGQFLILAIASRNLDSANLSQFVLAQSIGNLLTVMGLGMHITEQAEMPRNSESDGWRIYTACNMLLVPIASIILIATYIFSSDTEGNINPIYLSGACLSIALIADQIQSGALRARHMHEAVSRIDLAAKLTALPLVYLGTQHKSIGCTLAIITCTLFAVIAKIATIKKIKPQGTKWTSLDNLKLFPKIIRSSRGPLLQQAGGQMFSSADKVVMAAAGGAQILGFYAILQQSCAALHLIPAQLLQPTIARVADSKNKTDKSSQLAQAIRTCLVITLLGAVMLYAAKNLIFKIIFNFPHDLTSNESHALLLMIVAYFFISAQTPFIYFLQGAGHALEVGLIWFISGLLALATMGAFIQAATTLIDYVGVRLTFSAALVPLMWLTVRHLRNAK